MYEAAGFGVSRVFFGVDRTTGAVTVLESLKRDSYANENYVVS